MNMACCSALNAVILVENKSPVGENATDLAAFLLQEALSEAESGSTFRNDYRNAATHF